MNLNYHKDLSLFKVIDALVPKQTNTERFIMLEVLCYIVHMSNSTLAGKCVFYKSQFASTFKVRTKFVSDAIKHLTAHELVKEVTPYQRATKTPASYTIGKAYIPAVLEYGTVGTGTLYQRSKVYKSKIDFKTERDLDLLSGDKSFPQKGNPTKPQDDQDYWNTINKGKIKNKK
jgi:hypothetical protein